jgi:hypothetical protein
MPDYRHKIKLIPIHLPGIANIESDAFSGGKSQEKWHLRSAWAQKIFQIYGQVEVDLFASWGTAQLTLYFLLEGKTASPYV